MKNLRVKVRYHTCLNEYDFAVFEGNERLLLYGSGYWKTEKAATRNAKAMAKRIGIPFDSEIVKQHGC